MASPESIKKPLPLLLTAFAVVACVALIVRTRPAPAAPATAPAGAGMISRADLVGRPAPDFTLPDLDGKPVALAALKGHVVVLDFWAIWCPGCVVELPLNTAIAARYADKGVKFYAINVDAGAEPIKAFLKSRGWSTPALVDPGSAVSLKYGVDEIPQSVVIDGNGKVIAADALLPEDAEKLLPVWIETALKSGQAAPRG